MPVKSVKRKKAEILRRGGKSYASISAELDVAKSTLSNWFVGKAWSDKVKTNLNNSRLKMAKRNLVAANIARRKIQARRRENYIGEAKLDFDKLVSCPLFLIGLGIYWGEGDKTNNGRVAVINTDPALLQIVASFYRQCLGVAETDLRIGLFIYQDINRDLAISFWSQKLSVPISQFIKVQVLKSRSRLTKNKSKYGICSLYCSSTELSIKIHEWIRLLSIHKISN